MRQVPIFSVILLLTAMAGDHSPAYAQQAEEPVVERRVEELLDRAHKLRLAVARGRERIARGEVDTVMIKIPFMDDELVSMAEAEQLAARLEEEARTMLRRAQEEQAYVRDQVQRLVSGIHKIKVPPPIPPEEASIVFGDLPDGDRRGAFILLGMDIGVAALDAAGRIGGRVMPPLKLIIITGKTFIAAEEGADVYLTRRTATYEKALHLLKDPKHASEFTAIVRAIRENRPLPENAVPDAIEAARAITSPELGSSTSRIVWNAMMSKEARNAALTRATIEAYGWVIGDVTERTVGRILVQRSPWYQQGATFLDEAGPLAKKIKNPTMNASLREGIEHANEIMEKSFTTYRIPAKGIAAANTFYRGPRFQEALKRRAAGEKAHPLQ